MTIYFRDDGAADAVDSRSQPGSSRSGLSKAQPPLEGERIIQIDMKERHSSQILERVLAETRAVPLQPTEEEMREVRDLEAMKKQAVVDRARINAIKEAAKQEAEMLRRARAMGGASEEE